MAGNGIKTGFHRPLATSRLLCLSPPGEAVSSIRRARDDILRCFHRPRATGYKPPSKPPPRPFLKGSETCPMRVAAAGAPSPSPRTTYHELRTTYPQGGHTGPPLRGDKARHKSRASTTGHKLQATCRRFVIPAGRALACASWSRPARSPSLVESSRNNGDEQRATKTKLRPNPDHWLGPGPQLPLG